MMQPNSTTNDHAANGRLGAGAKSPEGLAASSRNATKHGLSARNFCLLPNEDPNLFAQHQASMLATLAPRNPLELEQVEKIIEAKWLMNRLTEIETRALTCEIAAQRHERLATDDGPADIATREATLVFFAMEALETKSKTFANLARYRATHERSYYRAWNTLQKMRGGPKALATGAWPDLPLPENQDSPTHFRDPNPKPPPILQNEAPAISQSKEPKIEYCKTKPQAEPTEQQAEPTEPQAEPTGQQPQPPKRPTPNYIDFTPRE